MNLHHLALAAVLLTAAPALADDPPPHPDAPAGASSLAGIGDSAVQRLGMTAGGFVAQWALASAKADTLTAELDKLKKRLDSDEAELGYWRQWAKGVAARAQGE